MKYNEILKKIDGTGIHNYDQSAAAVRERLNINGGVCRGLAILWLKSRKEETDFWQLIDARDGERQPLITTLQKSVNLQAEYENAATSRWVIDEATRTTLSDAGLVFRMADVRGTANFGLGDAHQTANVANRILTAASRFYILSVSGDSGGHSIGIWRPYSLLGKSSQSYLFDPNIGEFRVDGAEQLKTLLQAIIHTGYSASGMDLNKRYVLWSFSDRQ